MIHEYILNQVIVFFLNKHETNLKFFVHDRQNQLSFQQQLLTADRSRYVVNDFCSRKMKSYKSVNLISIKVPDTQIYLKTTKHGFRTSMRQIQRFVYMMDRTG